MVPSIYFNGFSLNLANADMGALLLSDGRPVAKLNMSFTTAKTLAAMLSNLIDIFEKATQHNVMTTEEVTVGLQKIEAEQAKGS